MNKQIAIVLLGNSNYDARVLNMANSLINHGYFVDIIHNGFGLQCFCNNKLNTNMISLKFNGILKYLEWNIKLINFFKKKHYDKIIASDLYSLPSLCYSMKKTCIIYDSREIFSELAAHKHNPLKKKINKFVEKKCLPFVSNIMTSAHSDEKYLQQLYPEIKGINCSVIYNFAHIYSTSKFNLRKKLNINSKQKIFLYQGVIQKDRGIEKLINLIQQISNAVAVIIGSGEYENYYKNKYSYLSKQKKIFFMQRIPYQTLLSITKEADIGCLLINPVSLSNKLALPNKLFEYALCGVPSLASSLPNLEYYIKKYHLGKTVNIESAKEIITVANSLLQYQHKEKLKQTAQKYCSWQSQEKHFIRFIQNA